MNTSPKVVGKQSKHYTKLLTQVNFTQKTQQVSSVSLTKYTFCKAAFVSVSIFPSNIQNTSLLCKSKDRRKDEAGKAL